MKPGTTDEAWLDISPVNKASLQLVNAPSHYNQWVEPFYMVEIQGHVGVPGKPFSDEFRWQLLERIGRKFTMSGTKISTTRMDKGISQIHTYILLSVLVPSLVALVRASTFSLLDFLF